MDLKNHIPCHVWETTDVASLTNGTRCDYFVHRDQKFSTGTIRSAEADPNYLGGYRVYVKEEHDPVSIALFDKNTLREPERAAPSAALSVDGQHEARAARIATVVEAVKNLANATHGSVIPVTVRQRHPNLVDELVQLVEKQTAQRYEAIIELRVKEAVEQRVQAALKTRRDELEAQYEHDGQAELDLLRSLRDTVVDALAGYAQDRDLVDDTDDF